MAHSLTTAARQPDGSFTHAFSSTTFIIHSGPSGSMQTWSRGAESSQQEVAYVIGSGSHAFGYLIQIGDHLFQSPLSYYTKRREWDVAPGYEQSKSPDFSRPVTNECLVCHSGKSQPIPDTLNRYQTPPFADESITCERCHGNAEEHVRRPVPGSIVNPAKLNSASRDSICEQCHLTGELRIPNPGRTVADFRPGQSLEDIFTVYVAPQNARAGNAQQIKVVSHVERLALSLCARRSEGKLWCGTCHDPHAETKATPAFYREKCLGCHAISLEKSHAAPGRDCVACHMPSLPARDGGHTAFTDHRIARQGATETVASGSAASAMDDLVAWREPDAKFRERNLAIALVTHGLQDSVTEQVIRGYRLLNRVARSGPEDAALETALGFVLLRAGESREALKHFQKALSLRPAFAPYEVNLAATLQEAGESGRAVGHLEHALQLDPLLQSAVELLSRLYSAQGQTAQAEELLAHYGAAMGIKGSGGVLPNARK